MSRVLGWYWDGIVMVLSHGQLYRISVTKSTNFNNGIDIARVQTNHILDETAILLLRSHPNNPIPVDDSITSDLIF